MSPRIPMDDRNQRVGSAPSRGEGLALLYQGILTVIVRIQSGKQPIPPDLQRQMEGLLKEIEREAMRLGYRNDEIDDTRYAVVAFLDEAIRRSEDPNRMQWSSLQSKLYSEAIAGEGVYDRLRAIRSRRDSLELAEVLEVYCLCFLLGYEGKYALGGRGELDRVIEDLRDQIERIRGSQSALSPSGNLPEAPKETPVVVAGDVRWKQAAVASFAFACGSWIVLWLIMNSYVSGAISDILSP